MRWALSIFCIVLTTVASSLLADVREQIARLQDQSISEPDRLKVLVELGKAGPAAREALPVIKSLAADSSGSINLRGYATWALAKIDPPPVDQPGREFHVAAENPNSDDANPGTADKPWKTIQKAAEQLRPGDTVLIHTGIYREMVQPFASGEAERMITYRAAPGEKPIIRGSDLWTTEWKDEGSGVWSTPYARHAWDKPEKWPTPLRGPMFRCEQVIVDGEFLTHVETRDDLRKPNTFYTVDNGAEGTLYIHPPDGPPPGQRVIERSMRQHCFFPAVQGLGFIRVQGLTMQHSAGPEFSKDWGLNGARPLMSVRAGYGWVIEDNVFEWSNAQGLDIGAWAWGETGKNDPYAHDDFGHHQVRRNRANHNAVSGICATDAVRYNILEDNETSYNGHKKNFYGFEAAGLKLHGPKHCIVRRHIAKDNFGFGIWFDWDCIDDRVTECILTGNVGAGFFLEASAGPVLVDSNVIIGTRDAPPPPHHDDHPWGDGIYGHDANRLIAFHNYVTGCDGFAVRIRNLFGRIGPGDKPTTTNHNRIYNNFLLDNGRGAVCFNPEVPLAKDNKSDFNVLWQQGKTVQFRLQRTGSEVDWTKTLIGRRLKLSGDVHATIPLDEWQATLKQDVHSELVSPDNLFAGMTPEQICDRLATLSREMNVPKSEDELKPRPVRELIEMIQEPTPDDSQTLYNGIVIPRQWPPNVRHFSRDPMPVLYLDSPPKVISIDVGRQLFVDDFLIEQTTLTRTFHAAKARPSPVLWPDREWEHKQREPKDPPQAMPFSDGVWFDPTERMFKMWYQSGFNQSTCYATSRDGIEWVKPKLDVVPGTNIVHPGTRDSATVWMDLNETNRQRRYKMMRRDDASRLHEFHFSEDGIHWSDAIAGGNAYDRSTFFYNPFRRVWVLSIRGDSYWDETETADESLPRRFEKGHCIGVPRFRRYAEGADLIAAARSWPTKPIDDNVGSTFKHWHDPVMWVWADRLDAPRDDIGTAPELYNLDAIAYESLMLGAFSIWKGHTSDYPARDKINEIQLGFSRDGFHWDRPWRQPFIGVSESAAAPNHSNLQSAGGVCLIVGDELHFYFSQRQSRDIAMRPGVSSTGLATLRRDGFASMDAGESEGVLTTRLLKFSGKHLFVNADAAGGILQVELLDDTGEPIAPFTRDNCIAISADSTRARVEWSGSPDLSALAGRAVRARFFLTRGKLYSFWVSPETHGASHGYVAAGGPEFSGPVDDAGANDADRRNVE